MKISMNKKSNILSKILKGSLVLIIVFSVSIFGISYAEGSRHGVPGSGAGAPGSGPGAPGSGPGAPGSGTGIKINTGIKNPLGDSVPDIQAFIKLIIDFVLLIGIPIVALAIIYSGFLFVTSLGNSEKLTKAKKVFLYTLIGAAILLGANVISNAIKGTVDQITSENKK